VERAFSPVPQPALGTTETQAVPNGPGGTAYCCAARSRTEKSSASARFRAEVSRIVSGHSHCTQNTLLCRSDAERGTISYSPREGYTAATDLVEFLVEHLDRLGTGVIFEKLGRR